MSSESQAINMNQTLQWAQIFLINKGGGFSPSLRLIYWGFDTLRPADYDEVGVPRFVMRWVEMVCLDEVLEGSPMVPVYFLLYSVYWILWNGPICHLRVASFLKRIKYHEACWGIQNFPKLADGTLRAGKPLVALSFFSRGLFSCLPPNSKRPQPGQWLVASRAPSISRS